MFVVNSLVSYKDEKTSQVAYLFNAWTVIWLLNHLYLKPFDTTYFDTYFFVYIKGGKVL